MQKRILLVEDEPGLVLTLTDRLQAEEYHVTHEGNGLLALERAKREPFDLMILDVMLPGKNGFDILRDLRMAQVKTPVLMLTARGDLTDKVVGLKLGADDYLAKPFETLELLARIEAILRRTGAAVQKHADSGTQPLVFGDVEVWLTKAEIHRGGRPVELSAKEFHLLRYLLLHPHVPHSREQLLNEVWGYDSTPTTRTVDVHIAWLRQKLEANAARPQFILTVHGMGYKFVGFQG